VPVPDKGTGIFNQLLMEEQVKKKTNGKRNRNAGNDFERIVATKLREIGFQHVVTSRSESRNRDNSGIDVMNNDELTNGRLPYSIQCKCTTSKPPYNLLINELPNYPNTSRIVLHKFVQKQGGQFYTKGHYAIMEMQTFLDMAEIIQQQQLALNQIKTEQHEKSPD